ncbi:MAG: LptF/LptG family permease [Dysgonamonadaceae bacterium]|jgi:lipopolysaccharide export system permease protein|nr:LptF/LptG family permease [Dysgonamonadaceae bacterium]
MKLNTGLKIIDWYIIKKFLGTYLFTILLIIAITIVLDYNQKMEKFMQRDAPFDAIVFDYYMNFIPYFVNLFSPLFTFIAVIFFTSKLADNSEIIAILSSGVNFNRLMIPYMISALFIAVLTFSLNSYIIPKGNIKRYEFEDKYYKDRRIDYAANIQLEVDPNVVLYLDRYNNNDGIGTRISLDKFEGKTLKSRLTAQTIKYDSLNHWTINNYMIRNFTRLKEEVITGDKIDTILNIIPSDFLISEIDNEQMTTPQLSKYIERQKKRGIGNIQPFEIEFHKRFSMAFASFILTVIGASLSSRKIKGGMGLNIGIGLLLSFSYILFMQISSSFAVSGLLSPFVAVWSPNFLYIFIAAYLYSRAPR